MALATRSSSNRILYLGYLTVLAVAVILAVALLLVRGSSSGSSTNISASNGAASHGAPRGPTSSPAASQTSTTQSTPATTIPLPPTTTPAAVKPKPTTTDQPAVGTVYLPVNPGSGAGCTAGITEGNRWIKYTVQPGDNLTEIARCFDLNGYQSLYQNNAKVIGDNPNLIFPGQVFTIVNGVMTES